MISRRSFFLGTALASSAADGLPAAPDLTALLRPVLDRARVPALSAAVSIDGKVAASSALGIRRTGDSTAVTTADAFHLGSCTMAMTGCAIAYLIDARKLGWKSRIAELMPGLRSRLHPELQGTTVEALLSHRSGLSADNNPARGSLRELYRTQVIGGSPTEQRRRYLDLILAERPAVQPGSQIAYSNRNYVVLGALLEEVLGMPFEEVLKARVFEPLSMSTAGFGAPGQAGKLDQPRGHRVRGKKLEAVEPGPLADNPPVLAPAAGVHCSTRDWCAFLGALLNPAQPIAGFVSSDTLRQLLRPAFPDAYAAGWRLTKPAWARGPAYAHAGTNTLNFAMALIAPGRRIGLAVATNQGGPPGSLACRQASAEIIRHFLPTESGPARRPAETKSARPR